jgi:hypothetical protein
MPVASPTYQLSDAQYEQIQGFLPKNGHKGGQWKDHRLMIDGILWALSDGGRGRNLPTASAPGSPSMTASATGPARACGTASPVTSGPAR